MKTDEYRKMIADAFIASVNEALKTGNADWKANWQMADEAPRSGVNNRKYHGINAFWLSYVSKVMGYNDPRWLTFNQIKNKGWHLQKDSSGAKVEYWFPWDKQAKKTISWEDYNTLRALGAESLKDIIIIPKYFTVFNGSRIDGIEPFEDNRIEREVSPSEIIGKISKNMGVEIVNDQLSKCFYRPAEDKIHLPEPKYFNDDYAYNSTALHELSHASGAEKRLNRNIQNIFGSDSYAFEELVAELSSCFMGKYIPTKQTEEHFQNHQEYLKSWALHIKDKPEIFFKAVKEAEKAANYLEYQAELINEADYIKTLGNAMEIGSDGSPLENKDAIKVPDKMSSAFWEDTFKSGASDRYIIYQLKDSDESVNIRFMSSLYLEEHGLKPVYQNYEAVYSGVLPLGSITSDKLDDLYTQFNTNHPEDFKGRSLSVSDVIAIREDGIIRSFYVDSIGFKEVPDFLQSGEKEKTTVEQEEEEFEIE